MKRKCLKTNKISNQLVIDLRHQLKAISLALKPCYLWELTSGDCQQVLLLCHELNVDLNGLEVIQINDLIFIANIEYLLKHIKHLLNESFVALIDVSFGLHLPQLLTREQIHSKKSVLKNLFNELEVISTETEFTIVSISEEEDLCLICGALLGYPIIYCNNSPQRGNCLSCVPLCAYNVQTLSHNNSNQIIYSFSCPQIFAQLFESHINSWFESLRAQSLASCGQKLSINQEIKTNAFVLT